ncbi:MAG: sugar transferase [Flavobacteriaceae bacterium]
MYIYFKRLFDIIFAIIGLLLTSPIVLFVILLKKLAGEKEVFYIKGRVGKGGKLFPFIKLSSMTPAQKGEKTSSLTLSNDSRITPLGHFIRKTKIDEFPQFVNILRGELSFVGPRALMPKIHKDYTKEVKQELSKIRPGVTGLATAVFRNEAELLAQSDYTDELEFYKEVISPAKGAIEMIYIQNQGFILDISILLITIWQIFRPQSLLGYKWLIFRGYMVPKEHPKLHKIIAV